MDFWDGRVWDRLTEFGKVFDFVGSAVNLPRSQPLSFINSARTALKPKVELQRWNRSTMLFENGSEDGDSSCRDAAEKNKNQQTVEDKQWHWNKVIYSDKEIHRESISRTPLFKGLFHVRGVLKHRLHATVKVHEPDIKTADDKQLSVPAACAGSSCQHQPFVAVQHNKTCLQSEIFCLLYLYPWKKMSDCSSSPPCCQASRYDFPTRVAPAWFPHQKPLVFLQPGQRVERQTQRIKDLKRLKIKYYLNTLKNANI